MPPHCITYQDVTSAASLIAPRVHLTPVLTSSHFNALSSRTVLFKCEALQKTGSFKYRGATNAVLKAVAEGEERGEVVEAVVTHSSGNHAGAVALAGREAGGEDRKKLSSNVFLLSCPFSRPFIPVLFSPPIISFSPLSFPPRPKSPPTS